MTLPGYELQMFGCRARSQSLYRMRYRSLKEMWEQHKLQAQFSCSVTFPVTKISTLIIMNSCHVCQFYAHYIPEAPVEIIQSCFICNAVTTNLSSYLFQREVAFRYNTIHLSYIETIKTTNYSASTLQFHNP
jgi:hypothetical protein